MANLDRILSKENNKGADQTAQMHRLICAFVVGKPPSGSTKGWAILTLGLTCGVNPDWVCHKTHVESRDQVFRYKCVIDLHSIFLFHNLNMFRCSKEVLH